MQYQAPDVKRGSGDGLRAFAPSKDVLVGALGQTVGKST
jgi:hypothetical protein